jgi:hypothetical protein
MVPFSAEGNKSGEGRRTGKKLIRKDCGREKEKVGDFNHCQCETETMLEEEILRRISKRYQKWASVRKSAKFHTINISKGRRKWQPLQPYI